MTEIFAMEESYLDLYTLQILLKEGVEEAYPLPVWVKAEISGISVKQNGHCYLELSQSKGKEIIAKAKAVIWRYNYQILKPLFVAATGSDLAVGMEILAKVKLSYHEVWGLSLTVEEINPEFTLGEKELQKKKNIERLEKEGLMDLQKQFCLPPIPSILAVISTSTAAGYGDFCRHISTNEFGFTYQVDLYESTMQGQGCPASICSALEDIARSKTHYDAVLIIRGGGSELDLSCFDDYDLAVAIATFPAPILTAIGHERDLHIADLVANTFVKTPTALADLFIDCKAEEDNRITELENRLKLAFQSRIEAVGSRLTLLENNILSRAKWKVEKEKSRLENILKFILSLTTGRVSAAEAKLQFIEMKIASNDPRKVLEKGIPLILDSKGVRFDTVAGRKAGESIMVVMPDGRIEAEIKNVTEKV